MALLRRILLIIMSLAALALSVVAPATPAAAGGIPAPTLVSPANNTDTPVKDLVLKWDPVAGASQYQVRMSRNIDFTNNELPLPNGGLTTAPVFEVPVGIHHATYWWKVRAKVGSDWGPYAQAWQFLREWESLVHIVNAPSSSDPTLEWAPVPDASVYHVIIASSPVTGDDVLNQWTEGCWTSQNSYDTGIAGGPEVITRQDLGCDPEPMTDGQQYYWGVAAFDDTIAAAIDLPNVQLPCGRSDPQDLTPECDASYAVGGPFTFKAPTTGTVQQLSGLTTSWHADTSTANPCDATTACPITPTFSWTPVVGANFYVVSVYEDRDATTLYRQYVLFTGSSDKSPYPQFTPPDAFGDAQPGKPYFWQVESAVCGGAGVQCTAPAAAAQGCPTPVTGGKTVPTVTGASVSPAGPSGNQSMQGGTTGTVTLSGKNILAGACVTASAGVVTGAPSVGTNSVSFSYYAPVQGGDVTFQVENADGSQSTTSPAIHVVDSTTNELVSAINSFDKRSGPISLVSPANGATERNRAFTFSWNDYIASGSSGTYDPKNYELQIATDPQFNNVIDDIRDIDLTQYTPKIDLLGRGHFYWRVNGWDESGNQLTWSQGREVSVNGFKPSVHFTTANGVHVGQPLTLAFNVQVNGVNSQTVQVVPEGESVSHALAGTLHLGSTPTEYVFTPRQPLATGATYVIHVSPDLADLNNEPIVVTGGALRTTVQGHNTSRGWQFSSGWSRHRSSGSRSGSDMEAGAGSIAKIKIEGQNFGVYGCKGPGFGSISISVAGTTNTISEHQSFTRCGIALYRRALPNGIHTLRITVAQGVGSLDGVVA